MYLSIIASRASRIAERRRRKNSRGTIQFNFARCPGTNSLKHGGVYYSQRQRPLSLLHRYSRSQRNKRAREVVGQWRDKKKWEKEKERKNQNTYIRKSHRLYFCRFIRRSSLFNPTHASTWTNCPALISSEWENVVELVTARLLWQSLYIYVKTRSVFTKLRGGK